MNRQIDRVKRPVRSKGWNQWAVLLIIAFIAANIFGACLLGLLLLNPHIFMGG